MTLLASPKFLQNDGGTFIFKISLETFSTKSQARKNENKSMNTKCTKTRALCKHNTHYNI